MKLKNNLTYIYLLVFMLAPWFNGNIFDSSYIGSSESNNIEIFFQLNPCKISFYEFISNFVNIEDVNFKTDEYSPIFCYGRVSQFMILGGETIVYIGSSFFVSFLIKFIIFILLLKKIKVDSNIVTRIKFFDLIKGTVLISLLFFADQKFYSTKLYLFDLKHLNTYIFIFCFILLLLVFANENIYLNNSYFLNFSPFLFLFSGKIAHTNLNIFLIYFLLIGIQKIPLTNTFILFRKIYFFALIFWLFNARIVYVDYPNNYLGFTSTSYDFYSIAIYSVVFYFCFKGLLHITYLSIGNLSLEKIIKNFYIVLFINIIIYYLNSISKINSFIISTIIELNTENLDKNTIYSFLNNNLDLLINILFVSLLGILHYKTQFNFNKISLFFMFVLLLNVPNFKEIIYRNYVEINLKFFEYYNPTFLELLIGTGPLNFNQFNFESNSLYNFSYYSSFASFLLYFGLVGITIICFYLFYKILLSYVNFKLFLIQILFIAYLFFSDFINNIQLIINFFVLFSFFFNSQLNFKSDKIKL